MTAILRPALAAVLLIAGLSAAQAARNTGGGPDGVTVEDLMGRGFICKPFGDGMLHCSNPDNSVPDWVCFPNRLCTPGKPRRVPGGSGPDLRPLPGLSLMRLPG